MADETSPTESEETAIEAVGNRLSSHLKGEKKRRYGRFTVAALGSIPWLGGFLSASAAMHAEKDQSRVNEFQRQWVEELEEKIVKLGDTLIQIMERLDSFGDDIRDRLESPEYLALVGKGFRLWDQADTDEKRDLVRKLLSNACATELCPDDLIRLFLDWIDTYHEAHFRVIREVYQQPGITRGQIWDKIGKTRPREDSAEADVYKLLIRDLSTGGVIRQYRQTDGRGNFLKKTSQRSRASSAQTMKSAFDAHEPYELTELGRQFVHYTMNEVVPRIGASDAPSEHSTG